MKNDSLEERAIYTGSESFISSTKIIQIVLMANHVSYKIQNIANVDSFEVNPGETRRVKLRATSDELYTNADSSFYTISSPEDNTTYFSGTKLFYFGARYYDPELGIFTSTDPISDSKPQLPSLNHRLPPGMRLAALIGEEEAARVMGEIEASGYDPLVIEKWQQKILSNPYNYCFNNPINFFDPDGRWGLGHFFQTFFQEFTHQVAIAFTEIGNGLIDVIEGSATFNFEKVGKGLGSVFEGIGGTLWAPIEATGTAAYSMMPDIENYAYGEHSQTKLAGLLRKCGVGHGGDYSGAHGFSQDYDTYTKRYKKDVNSGNLFNRWRAKGHLAHTAQDAHIHRNANLMKGHGEDIIEGFDGLRPEIWIPASFFTFGDYERTVYGY